jgi:ElaB/YqjD/DUF883 family membrane-anchored ribosome-binding protein
MSSKIAVLILVKINSTKAAFFYGNKAMSTKTKASVSKNSRNEVTNERLMEDLHLVVTDAEELLRATANPLGVGAVSTHARIQENLQAVKDKLIDAETAVAEGTRQAAETTEQYVQNNPWKSIGISAGVGLLVGILLARR